MTKSGQKLLREEFRREILDRGFRSVEAVVAYK
jgi:hypothetical protein